MSGTSYEVGGLEFNFETYRTANGSCTRITILDEALSIDLTFTRDQLETLSRHVRTEIALAQQLEQLP